METSQDPAAATIATEAPEKGPDTEASAESTVTKSSTNPVVDESISSSNLVAPTSQNQDSATSSSEEIVITLRHPTDRPVYKLSIKLIETYKHINKVYYEAKAKRLKEQKDTGARSGVHNDGYDDANYDYILGTDEIFADRYIIKHKMGKGSFGQVVCAYDQVLKCEVAVKIIKSRKPFLLQAQTEIELLNKILEQDEKDEANIVRLLNQFVYRNHQCLVFEILSFNLYELLKNTKFRGVSLNLTRKFSRYLLVALELLASPEVNIIHCDLKPENILLRHPRRSAIKLIDFGSSCYLTKRTYSYIQSRFYRSPEVLLGLPYTQKIDMWSLGCVAVEMHTGEPLFGGLNQADQICRMVDVLGMPPLEMILKSPEKVRSQFFERIKVNKSTSPGTANSGESCVSETPKEKDNKEREEGEKTLPSSSCDLKHIVWEEDKSSYFILKRPANREQPKPRTLIDILGVHSGGPSGRRAGEADHSPDNYLEFLDFVQKLLVYSPEARANPTELLSHPYIVNTDNGAPAVQPAEKQGDSAPATGCAVPLTVASTKDTTSAKLAIETTQQPTTVPTSVDCNTASSTASTCPQVVATTTENMTAACDPSLVTGLGSSTEEGCTKVTPLPDINTNNLSKSEAHSITGAAAQSLLSSGSSGANALPQIRSKSAPGER